MWHLCQQSNERAINLVNICKEHLLWHHIRLWSIGGHYMIARLPLMISWNSIFWGDFSDLSLMFFVNGFGVSLGESQLLPWTQAWKAWWRHGTPGHLEFASDILWFSQSLTIRRAILRDAEKYTKVVGNKRRKHEHVTNELFAFFTDRMRLLKHPDIVNPFERDKCYIATTLVFLKINSTTYAPHCLNNAKAGMIEIAGLIAYDLYCFPKLFFAILMILWNIKTQNIRNRKLQNIPKTAQLPKLAANIQRYTHTIVQPIFWSSLFATSLAARFLQEFTQISPIGFDAIGGGCLGWHVHGFGHGLLLIRTSAAKQKAPRGSGSFRSVVGRMGKMEDHNEYCISQKGHGAW